jgi:hypothetical protein
MVRKSALAAMFEIGRLQARGLTFGEQGLAGLRPATAAGPGLDQAVFYQKSDSVFTSPHAFMVQPVLLSTTDALFTHPRECDQ